MTTISMAIPITIRAAATSHTRIRGSMRAATRKRINTTAEIISIKPDIGLSIIPIHASDMEHIGIGICSVISVSSYFKTSPCSVLLLKALIYINMVRRIATQAALNRYRYQRGA